ncbi:TraB/GumN family protein [Ascidiaceihabitans sp.]|uniref:TraB/GumN family protein n=1 Tax=Ascidiaceihabitans sp. TaxID=1872644 RepID=UPI003297CE5F
MLSALACSVSAQDWFTYDACQVDTVALHDTAVAPANLDALITDGAALPNGVGNFWRITSTEGMVSHIWGTNHSNDPKLLDLPQSVRDAITAARVVALETDFVFQSRTKMEQVRSGLDILREPGEDASQVYTEIDLRILAWLKARLDGIGWGADAVEWITPTGLAEILLNDPCSDFASGTYPTQDSLIQTLGAIAGAKIMGLEPQDAFLEHLNKPENRGLAFDLINLYGATLNPAAPDTARATSYALYLQGRNGAAMMWERSAAQAFFGHNIGPALVDRVDAYLLVERNRQFLEAALPELAQGGLFMAIGSWHLPTETGMIAVLRDAGFKVDRIPTPKEVAQ